MDMEILILDDQLGPVENSIHRIMDRIGARLDPDNPRQSNLDFGGNSLSFLLPLRVGVSLRLKFSLSCLPSKKTEMLAAATNPAFLEKFEIICVDVHWEKMVPDFGAADFQKLAYRYEAASKGGSVTPEIGFILAELVRAAAPHDPIMVMFSEVAPTVEAIARTRNTFGLYQYLRKDDHMGFLNLILLAAGRVEDRLGRASLGANTRALSSEEHSAANMDCFALHTPERQMIDLFGPDYATTVSKADLVKAARIPVDEDKDGIFDRRLANIRGWFLLNGYRLEEERDQFHLARPLTR